MVLRAPSGRRCAASDRTEATGWRTADGEAAVIEGFPLEELHPFTVEQYHRMADAGIVSPDDRVEFIEGVVVSMAPIGSQHFAITLRTDRLLRAALGDRATVSVQRAGKDASPIPTSRC